VAHGCYGSIEFEEPTRGAFGLDGDRFQRLTSQFGNFFGG
jgi:hypothetical protein